MIETRNDHHQQHQPGQWVGKSSPGFRIACAMQVNDQADEKQHKRHVGNGCQPLAPEMLGPFVCGTQSADFLERCAHFTHCPASFTKP